MINNEKPLLPSGKRVDQNADRAHRDRTEEGQFESARVFPFLHVEKQKATAGEASGSEFETDAVRRLETRLNIDGPEIALVCSPATLTVILNPIPLTRAVSGPSEVRNSAVTVSGKVPSLIPRDRPGSFDCYRPESHMLRQLNFKGSPATEAQTVVYGIGEAEVKSTSSAAPPRIFPMKPSEFDVSMTAFPLVISNCANGSAFADLEAASHVAGIATPRVTESACRRLASAAPSSISGWAESGLWAVRSIRSDPLSVPPAWASRLLRLEKLSGLSVPL